MAAITMIRSRGRKGLVAAGAFLSVLAMMASAAHAAPAAGSAPVVSAASAGGGVTSPATRTSHTAVHIVVPPVAVILLYNGSPIAVETNTSRSPRRGDMFFTTDSPMSQDLDKATHAQMNQILKTVGPVAVWQPGWHYIGRN
jgi:hypothetical protein